MYEVRSKKNKKKKGQRGREGRGPKHTFTDKPWKVVKTEGKPKKKAKIGVGGACRELKKKSSAEGKPIALISKL